MSSQDVNGKIVHYSKLMINNLFNLLKSMPRLINEYKSAIIIIIAWISISEIAGYSIIELFTTIFKLIIYPYNWIVYKTQFELTGIPEIFILIIPLVVLITVGFLIIISTED
ncbi:MAG: hypothetical protein ACFFAJ_01645 [Candidatus Hodarchaeota archaeon]